MVGPDLLYLACRHHMYEIALRAAFAEKMSKSSAAEVTIFKGFQKAWPKMDQSNFRSSIEEHHVRGKLQYVH